jgi:hypothetical protein
MFTRLSFEATIVIPVVVGSSPISHPKFPLIINRLRSVFYCLEITFQRVFELSNGGLIATARHRPPVPAI